MRFVSIFLASVKKCRGGDNKSLDFIEKGLHFKCVHGETAVDNLLISNCVEVFVIIFWRVWGVECLFFRVAWRVLKRC